MTRPLAKVPKNWALQENLYKSGCEILQNEKNKQEKIFYRIVEKT